MSIPDFDDDMVANSDLVEAPGRVAIWLNIAYEEDNRVIGWYDHDYAEGAGFSGSPQPIRELLSGGSYWQSWSPAAVEAAVKHGITEAETYWMLYDHEYLAEPGPLSDKDNPAAFYLGSFEFTMPED